MLVTLMKAIKKKILLVDDEAQILTLMERRLRRWGYEVISAQSAAEFEEKAFADKPDLIILDIILGEAQGPVVYDDLLTRGLDREIPVIFLSALVEDDVITPGQPGHRMAMHNKLQSEEELSSSIQALLTPASA